MPDGDLLIARNARLLYSVQRPSGSSYYERAALTGAIQYLGAVNKMYAI